MDKFTPTATEHLEIFHNQCVSKLKKQLEVESWQSVDITDSYMACFQLFFDHSHDSRSLATEEIEKQLKQAQKIQNKDSTWVNDAKRAEEESKLLSDELLKQKNSQFEESGFIQFMKNELIIDGKRYQLTSSVLTLVQIIYDYLHLGYRYQEISTDCALKTAEILSFYNTMSNDLILNAGVTQFKIVKVITAKILGISASCVSLLKMLIEPILTLIEKKLDLKTDLAQIDRIRTQFYYINLELYNHYNNLKTKIVAVLQNKITQICTSITALEWTNQSLKFDVPTKYTIQIMNSTHQMWKNIKEFFPPEELSEIFSRVFEQLNAIYLGFFSQVKIEARVAAQRVKEELEHFILELRNLKDNSNLPTEGVEMIANGIVAQCCAPLP